MKRAVPELSLADFEHGDQKTKVAFSEALMAGLQDYGFIILKDHGIAPDLLEQAYAQSAALFALPIETKLSMAGGLRGYTPFGKEHAKGNSFPDLKEFWQIGWDVAPDAPFDPLFPPNVWPDQDLPSFRAVFAPLFEGLNATGMKLLRALAPQLQLAEDFFDPLVARGTSLLRVLHYPPIPEGADPNCVRAAAHEDINFLTLLVAAKGAGLELLDRDGTWLPVETQTSNLIVDSGDMLARLTNGVIPSTTHRVVNPTGPNVSRYSMPFFMHPSVETSLACLPSCVGAGAKFAPITAGAFLAERLKDIGLKA